MKILLTTLNAKFTHHNLALRYLRAYCQPEFPELVVREYNINQQLSLIQSELVDQDPDVLGFSCYIWNIEQTLELITNIKKVLLDVVIVLGGPEVSYEYEPLMNTYPQIDYIVSGEGEEPFLRLLKLLEQTKAPDLDQLRSVPGLVYRSGSAVISNPNMVMDLAQVPGAYQDHLDELEHKIVYFEGSRGCPYRCEYCLSSRTGKVRYFPLDQVKAELAKLSKLGIEQIRFVDRTFNCDRQRAYELLEFMIELDTNTRFQLEIGGDLLTEELIQLLERAPENRLQFEIGVQSTNPATLQEIGRTTDLNKLAENCRKLRERTKVRFLLDLIAGLPDESFERFGHSFDFVYELKPTKIQLGFLKLLKGSRLRERADEFGCAFTDKAPYEVLQTDSISYQELAFMKIIESLVDSFYNSGRFTASLDYLIARDHLRPFVFFSQLAEEWKARGYHLVSHNLFNLYRMLWELMGENDPILHNYLRFDFRANEQKRATPDWLQGGKTIEISRRLINDGTIFNFLPHLEPLKLSPRELNKLFVVEQFDYRIYPWSESPGLEQQYLLFDYSRFPVVKIHDLSHFVGSKL